jgi:hypothetical protein
VHLTETRYLFGESAPLARPNDDETAAHLSLVSVTLAIAGLLGIAARPAKPSR